MRRAYHRVITTPAAARASRGVVRPFVSLLTDFGTRDPSAAICRAVVLGIAPDAIVVDVSHEVEPFAIRQGALLLWSALPYLPVGAHVAVVDPGVGTERRAVALETERGDVLLGPDNGLLLPAAERVGGIARAHLLENHEYRLPIVSSSFHGRDVFAPAAAHVALGTPVEALGPEIGSDGLVRLDWPEPQANDGELTTAVIYLDTFGNAKFAGGSADLSAALGGLSFGESVTVRVGNGGLTGPGRDDSIEVPWQETFGRVAPGGPLLYEDSYGRLCLAVNQGSAARHFGLQDGSVVRIARAEQRAAGRPDRIPKENAPIETAARGVEEVEERVAAHVEVPSPEMTSTEGATERWLPPEPMPPAPVAMGPGRQPLVERSEAASPVEGPIPPPAEAPIPPLREAPIQPPAEARTAQPAVAARDPAPRPPRQLGPPTDLPQDLKELGKELGM